MTLDLAGDKPLPHGQNDRLGFSATAEAIAASILRQPAIEGLVIGIEGRWGSGKSSLVGMILAAMRTSERKPAIIEFKPWLVGSRDGLLLALFVELAAAVVAIEEEAGNPVERRRRDAKALGERIRRFAARLGGVGKAAKAMVSYVPLAGILGPLLEGFSDLAKSLDGAPSLSGEKNELRKRLGALPRPIVVTIDDVDRLEPGELVEILRLVRSVADFPNVAYVLCYDPRIVAHSIEAAAQVEDGRAYIEKIVQIAVPVPRPEAFDLRRWFGEGIDALPNGSDDAGSSRSRLTGVIDVEGGRHLTTPRHVVRCLDGIRFFWGTLEGKVDLADLVWLHLVKSGNPRLYDWVEEYMTEVSAQASGLAIVSEDGRRASRRRLDKALRADGGKFEDSRHRLSDFLPGIDEGMGFGKKDDPGIHGDFSKDEMAIAARDMRLASPDHYRLYFAVQQPRNAPRRSDFEDLFAALDSPAPATSNLLSRWNADRLSSGATKAEAVLARIAGGTGSVIGAERAAEFLCALADVMDDMAAVREEGIGDPQAWIEGRRIARALLPLLADRREPTLDRMFRGRALDWLTTILRSETFAHGRVDGKREGEGLLLPDELDRATAIMVERYRKLRLDEWKALRRPLSALFAWYQAGDPDGAKAMVAGNAATDEGLVGILEVMGGRVSSSSRGEFIALKESTLEYFMDYAEARARTERLAKEAGDPDLRARAEVLRRQFEHADGY